MAVSGYHRRKGMIGDSEKTIKNNNVMYSVSLGLLKFNPWSKKNNLSSFLLFYLSSSFLYIFSLVKKEVLFFIDDIEFKLPGPKVSIVESFIPDSYILANERTMKYWLHSSSVPTFKAVHSLSSNPAHLLSVCAVTLSRLSLSFGYLSIYILGKYCSLYVIAYLINYIVEW